MQELIISKEEITFNEENYKENIKVLFEHGVGLPEQMKEPINPVKLLESGYRVEFTSGGWMTLAAENEGSKFYFHTNSRIQSEAFLLARHWYQKDAKKYILYGFGMGYHINELQAMITEAEIEIYEADINVLQLACAFADVKEILLDQRIKLIFDPELELLKLRVASLETEEIFLVHYPSYKNIRSSEGKEILKTALPWSNTIEAC